MGSIKEWYNSVPMRYWQPSKDKNVEQDILMNPSKYSNYIGTKKMDGQWTRVIVDENNEVTVQSRTVSKKTGTYGDLTEKVPHLVELFKMLPPETVILGELCYWELDKHSDEVGTILRCLPKKAIERQKTAPLNFYVFDVLVWGGNDISSEPYQNRSQYLCKIKECQYIKRAELMTINQVVDEYEDYLDKGGEGFVLVSKDRPYSPGTRTAWSSIKLKRATRDLELKVIGTIEPNKDYEGQDVDSWQYFLGGEPVTKRYFNRWKNGVIVDFDGTEVKVTSGCSDEDAEWLSTKEAQDKIANGELFAVIRSMQVTKDGSLRHPVLVRLREDM